MTNIKKVDCALLPPCSDALKQKLRRAQLVSTIWGKANLPQPAHHLDPLDYGWKEENGCYVPIWFTGPSLPEDLFEEEVDKTPAVGNDEQDTEYDDAEDSFSEPSWSDDSDSEADI